MFYLGQIQPRQIQSLCATIPSLVCKCKSSVAATREPEKEKRMPREIVRQISEKITVPMIAAPMFLVSGPELVAATCEAGVIGSFPFPNARTIDVLDEWLDELGRRVGGNPEAAPYAVNLLSHLSYDRLADEIALIKNHKPKVVITALGGPEPVIDTVHAYGGTVIADVNSIKYARKAIEKGADGVALVCSGAGGHTGHMSAFAFVSAVREFFDGLVVAAGSIGNGRAVRAAADATGRPRHRSEPDPALFDKGRCRLRRGR